MSSFLNTVWVHSDDQPLVHRALAVLAPTIDAQPLPHPHPAPPDIDTLGIVIFSLSCHRGVSAELQEQWSAIPPSTPKLIVVFDSDQAPIDVVEMTAICKRALDEECTLRFLPLLDEQEHVAGALDLLTAQVIDASSGTTMVSDADADHLAAVMDVMHALHEDIAVDSDDDSFFTRFTADLPIQGHEWAHEFTQQVREGRSFPLFAVYDEPGHWSGSELVAQAIASICS